MVNNLIINSPIGKSDHAVLHFNFTCYLKINSVKKLKILYDKGDFASMRKEMAQDWADILSEYKDDVEKQLHTFLSHLKKSEEAHIPHKYVEVGNKKKWKCPLDEKTRRKIRKKHRCWQRYMESRDAEKYREYCKIRNNVKKVVKKMQRDREKVIAKQAKCNPKAFWAYANS